MYIIKFNLNASLMLLLVVFFSLTTSSTSCFYLIQFLFIHTNEAYRQIRAQAINETKTTATTKMDFWPTNELYLANTLPTFIFSCCCRKEQKM